MWGLCFYLWAGLWGVRRGGEATGGLRTGGWAGIISTVSFWIVLPIGILISIAQAAQNLVSQARSSGRFLPFDRAFGLVWNYAFPPSKTVADFHQATNNIVTFV